MTTSNFFSTEGNIGNNFELRKAKKKGTDEQISVLNFSLRTPVRRKDSEGEYQDTKGFWVNVSYWGKLAEMTHRLMKPGIRVCVTGELSEDEYVPQSGEKAGETQTTRNLRADSVTFSPLGIEAITYKPKANKEEGGANANGE